MKPWRREDYEQRRREYLMAIQPIIAAMGELEAFGARKVWHVGPQEWRAELSWHSPEAQAAYQAYETLLQVVRTRCFSEGIEEEGAA